MNYSSERLFSQDHRTLASVPSRLAAGIVAAFVMATALVAVAPQVGAAGMEMTPSEVSVVCNDSYGAVGRITGASPSEPITFASSPATTFLPAFSNTSGNYNVIWKCGAADVGTQFSVVATGSNSARSTSFIINAVAAPPDTLPAAGTNVLTNPGVESGNVDPWQVIDQSGTTTVSASNASAAQAGTWALLASSGATSGGSVGQDVSATIDAGTTFTASIWARHPHAGGTPQSANIVLETIGGTTESSVLAITVTDAWQRFDITLSVESAGHTGLRTKVVMLTPASAGRGNYLFDSASLVESSPNPMGSLELVTASTGAVEVTGYAIDPNDPHASVPITVTVGAAQTGLTANVVRPDVAVLYPSYGPVHGFTSSIATQLTGSTQVCAYATNLGVGADTTLGCTTVVIPTAATTTTSTTTAPTTSTTAGPTTTTTAPTTTAPTTTAPTTTAPTTTAPTTTAPTTTAPATTAPATTAPATTATPTTAPSTTAVPATTVAPTTTTSSSLTPQTFAPSQTISLFSATTVDELTSAYDFTEGDGDTLRLYWAFFNREADLAGAKYWIGQSRLGMSLDDMAFHFSQSIEFQLTYGSVSDHAFLDIVYRNVLGRRYDVAGYEYWLTLINRGLRRSDTVRWIAANPEFVDAHPYGI